jgi:hypothetical protein
MLEWKPRLLILLAVLGVVASLMGSLGWIMQVLSLGW